MFRSINKFIIFLISLNMFGEMVQGFVAPVLAIFARDHLAGGTLATAGVAIGIFWITKSILQIFVGRYLDAVGGEKNEFLALLIGNTIIALVPFLYLGVTTTSDLYLVQGLLGIGGALAVPPWFVLFSRHIDKNKETLEWSINSTVSFGIGAGVSGIIGGQIVEALGFSQLFVIAGLAGIVSIFLTMPLYKYLVMTAPVKTQEGERKPLPQNS